MTQLPPTPELNWAWFFDIDGTLASIELSPDAVRVDGVMQYLIEGLHEKTGGAVALVSGRSLRDIDKLFPHFTLAAAGQHGAERRHANGVVVRRPVPGEQLLAMRDALREMERGHAGLMLEDKGLSLSMHYRRVPHLGALVEQEIRLLILQMGAGFQMQLGKCVVEIVPTGHNKGSVVNEFLVESPFVGRVPAFLGDDVTDETAFAVVNALGGISIKVGAGPTVAPYRLSDVPAVRDWLASLPQLTVLNHSDAGDAV